MVNKCSLCGLGIASHCITDGPYAFCCHGCQAVFGILSTKNQLENFKENPIFKQAVQAGLISNPELLEQMRSKQNDDGDKVKMYLEIQDMWCPSCAEVIKLLLLQEKGVCSCTVDYTTDLAAVEFMPIYISKEKIHQIITRFGYKPVSLESPEQQAVSGALSLRFIIAAFFALNIMMFAYPLYATYFAYDDQGIGPLFAWLSFFASLPVVAYCGFPIGRRFYYSLKAGLLGMETLVVLGVSAAFGLSVYELLQGGVKVYFDSMAVIIAFVLLGKVIEAKAKFSAKDALQRLRRSLPKRGRKQFDDGRQEFVPIKEILPGDCLVALTGEKIVLDGIVIDGQGACDESLINGESMPVLKVDGSFVLGGSLLNQGKLCYRVAMTKEESSLQRIFAMVEDDMVQKTQYVRAADRIVPWFVPVVIVMAILAGVMAWVAHGDTQDAMVRAVSVLLISCPCAIGIAAPLAESHVLNALAKLGVIVRNRGCLSHLGKETVYVFDKTGTMTEGKFTVLKGLESLNDHQLAILKGLARCSIHPISVAIHHAIPIPAAYIEKVDEYAGKGIKGIVEGIDYYLGSALFVKEVGIPVGGGEIPCQEEGSVTTVYFNQFPIYLGDQIRCDAKSALQELFPAKFLLLSGDSKTAVEAVAKHCGIQDYRWGANPLQKKLCIEGLRSQKEVVCMLGDGINDAPALSAAHIGISVVTATDVSIQVSDILLTTERLDILAEMRRLGKKGRRIVQQNLFWAFFYNIIGMGLAAAGYLSPIFAAFAMVVSSLTVTLNAQRLPIQRHFPRFAGYHRLKSLFKFVDRIAVGDDRL